MSTALSDLTTALNYRLNSDPNGVYWTTSERTDYLNEAHQYICNFYKWPFMLKTGTAINLVEGTQAYTFPTDVQDSKLYSLVFSSTEHSITSAVLQEETTRDYQERVQNLTISNGIPERYHLDYNSSGTKQIVLDVPPDFSETGGLIPRYYKVAGTLSVSTDTTNTPDDMKQLILEYAMSLCRLKEDEGFNFSTWKQEFDNNLNLMKQQYTKGSDYVPNVFATPTKDIYPNIY